MKTIVVNSSDDLEKVLIVCQTFMEKSAQIDVTVKNHKEAIVDGQRKLYWKWITVIGADLGYIKEEMHEKFKEAVFLNTYIADSEHHPRFNGLTHAMQTIKIAAPEKYETIRENIIAGVSHLAATKKNWMDILKYLEVFAADRQIRLPAPERKGLTHG